MKKFRYINAILLKQFHKSSTTRSIAIPSVITNKLLFRPLIPQLSDRSSFGYTENPIFQISKRHVGHSHHDQTSEEGDRIFRLGLAADVGLTARKVLTGYLSGSTAIIADAAHSLSDVVLSGVAFLSLELRGFRRTKNTHMVTFDLGDIYTLNFELTSGHGKFETLGALGISGVLLLTAGGIAWHALDVLVGVLSAASEVANQSLPHQNAHSHSHHHGIDMNHPILALNTTIVAIAVKEGLYWMTKKAGEKTGSGLMIANAWHHRADAVSSLVALIGVGGSILGVRFLDPLAGLVVSGMILKAGLQTGYQSILELVDAAIPSHHLDPIRKTVLQVTGVEGCRHLRGRRAGSSLYLDVMIEVDPFCSISMAHQIGESVRYQIQNSHPEVSEVFIQLEPATKQEIADVTCDSSNLMLEDNRIEEMVTKLLPNMFSEKAVVKCVRKRKLEDKFLLEVEVSMPVDALIRSDELKVPVEYRSLDLQVNITNRNKSFATKRMMQDVSFRI